MNTPNKLTLLRVLMIPLMLWLLYFEFPNHQYLALGIFILASLTDLVDGYLARSRNQVTDFGKFMDPLADKLLVVAAMAWFVETGRMPGWCLLVVVAREFAVTALRLVAVGDGQVIAAGWSGKIKTASTMGAICVMLLNIPPWLNTLAWAVILITTVYSGVDYFWQNRDLIKEVGRDTGGK